MSKSKEGFLDTLSFGFDLGPGRLWRRRRRVHPPQVWRV